MNKQIQAIGSRAPRLDAYAKVTGAEKYAADHYPAGHLWTGVKRSGQAHARIVSIETSEAAAVQDVVCVLTHADIRGKNRLGIFEKDQPILADSVVRHYGDAVALVVAQTPLALAQGLAQVKVVYEALPAVYSPADALRQDAPVLHPGRSEGNVLLQAELSIGDKEMTAGACPFHITLEIETGWQEHAFLETQNGVAQVREDGVISMTVSTQTPFRDRMELAEALGMPPTMFHIAAPSLGGAFGGKDGITVQGFLALAAMHSGGKPVKLIYSREESILAGVKRHPMKARYALGCDENGMLQALDCELLFDTGAYASLGAEVFALAMEHAGGPYRIPNATIRGKVVYTNNPVAGAFRGFGVPQAAAGIEQAIDELAKKAGIDALEFRRRNVLDRGETTPSGVKLTRTFGLGECLARLQAHRFWREREQWEAEAPVFKKRGVGVAAAFHGVGFGPAVADYANAKLELTPEGKVRVFAGVADMGQGNATTCAQIASHILCQPYENIELVMPDTDRTLPSASSSASRTTFTFGNALKQAAEHFRDRLRERAALLLSFQLLQSVSTGELELLPGCILHPATGRSVPLALLAGIMDAAERIVTQSYTSPVNEQHPATGENLRKHGFPHRVFTSGAQCVRLEVDTLTGCTSICDLVSVVDAGNILNPQVYEQQVEGGAAQGLGFALFENFIAENGRIVTDDLSRYILPTALDLPDMETVPVIQYEEDGPFGMKGIGEIGIDAVYPAVANALATAVERRVKGGPFTAEKVLAALDQSGPGGMP